MSYNFSTIFKSDSFNDETIELLQLTHTNASHNVPMIKVLVEQQARRVTTTSFYILP